jgi:succinate dehydrogenase / fumarate reductase cytochrome b subunit
MSTPASKARPLSPHLQIYKPTWTMTMSIVHRITGAGLYFGTILLAWWLIAAASGPQAFASAQWFFSSFLGRLILFGFTWALFHHMLGGIRHFLWDFGKGFGREERFLLAKATLGGSIALTILTWVVAYAMS